MSLGMKSDAMPEPPSINDTKVARQTYSAHFHHRLASLRTFEYDFPVTPNTVKPHPLCPSQETNPRMTTSNEQMDRKHIFAVNGSPDFLALLRQLFQEKHYNVTTTNFVPKTYAQIAALEPDLLLIDLAVGERAGLDLLERLGKEAATKGIPVIVLSTSSYLLDEAQADPGRFGGQHFLAMPFDLDDLLSMVSGLIGPA